MELQKNATYTSDTTDLLLYITGDVRIEDGNYIFEGYLENKANGIYYGSQCFSIPVHVPTDFGWYRVVEVK